MLPHDLSSAASPHEIACSPCFLVEESRQARVRKAFHRSSRPSSPSASISWLESVSYACRHVMRLLNQVCSLLRIPVNHRAYHTGRHPSPLANPQAYPLFSQQPQQHRLASHLHSHLGSHAHLWICARWVRLIQCRTSSDVRQRTSWIVKFQVQPSRVVHPSLMGHTLFARGHQEVMERHRLVCLVV